MYKQERESSSKPVRKISFQKIGVEMSFDRECEPLFLVNQKKIVSCIGGYLGGYASKCFKKGFLWIEKMRKDSTESKLYYDVNFSSQGNTLSQIVVF